jgi:hypothetical protein
VYAICRTPHGQCITVHIVKHAFFIELIEQIVTDQIILKNTISNVGTQGQLETILTLVLDLGDNDARGVHHEGGGIADDFKPSDRLSHARHASSASPTTLAMVDIFIFPSHCINDSRFPNIRNAPHKDPSPNSFELGRYVVLDECKHFGYILVLLGTYVNRFHFRFGFLELFYDCQSPINIAKVHFIEDDQSL